MVRRRFERQYKISVAKLVLHEKKSVRDVSQKLNIHENTIYRWIKEYETHGDEAYPGNGLTRVNAQKKVKAVKAQQRYFQEELDFLRMSKNTLSQE